MKITSIGYSNPYSTQKTQKSMNKTNSSPSFGERRFNPDDSKKAQKPPSPMGSKAYQEETKALLSEFRETVAAYLKASRKSVAAANNYYRVVVESAAKAARKLY